MNNAASKTANYKFTLQSIPTVETISPLQSTTSSSTQSSPHDPTKAPNYVSVGDFKTGGKLKIKLK